MDSPKSRVGPSLQRLSQEMGYSPPVPFRLLLQACRVGLHRYREKLRIRRACEIMTDPTVSITTVALELGYSSPQHFSKRFSEMTGVSPRKYQLDVADKHRIRSRRLVHKDPPLAIHRPQGQCAATGPTRTQQMALSTAESFPRRAECERHRESRGQCTAKSGRTQLTVCGFPVGRML